MSFKSKISSINSTQELVGFIKSINSEVSFLHGRKFSYEKNGETISYNKLVTEIHLKLQNSKEWDGSRIVTELKLLNSNAEKKLKSANIFTRIFTCAKRFFTYFQRDLKLKEIAQNTSQKMANGLRSCRTDAFLPVSPMEESAAKDKVHDLKPLAQKITQEPSESTLPSKEQLAVCLEAMDVLKKDQAKRNEDTSPGIKRIPVSFKKTPEHLVMDRFSKLIQDKFSIALKKNGLPAHRYLHAHTHRYHKNTSIECLLSKPNGVTQNKVRGQFRFLESTPGKDSFKSEKDYPDTMKFCVNFSVLKNIFEGEPEKLLEEVDTIINRSISYIKKLNLVMNDNLLSKDPDFFCPSKTLKFDSLGVNGINLELGESDVLVIHGAVNATDESNKKSRLEVSISSKLTDQNVPHPDEIATAIKEKVIKNFDSRANIDPSDWSYFNDFINDKTIESSDQSLESSFKSLAELMENQDLLDLFKNNKKETIELFLTKKNIQNALRKHHPDRGGKEENFVMLKKSLTQVQEWLKADQ